MSIGSRSLKRPIMSPSSQSQNKKHNKFESASYVTLNSADHAVEITTVTSDYNLHKTSTSYFDDGDENDKEVARINENPQQSIDQSSTIPSIGRSSTVPYRDCYSEQYSYVDNATSLDVFSTEDSVVIAETKQQTTMDNSNDHCNDAELLDLGLLSDPLFANSEEEENFRGQDLNTIFASAKTPNMNDKDSAEQDEGEIAILLQKYNTGTNSSNGNVTAHKHNTPHSSHATISNKRYFSFNHTLDVQNIIVLVPPAAQKSCCPCCIDRQINISFEDKVFCICLKYRKQDKKSLPERSSPEIHAYCNALPDLPSSLSTISYKDALRFKDTFSVCNKDVSENKKKKFEIRAIRIKKIVMIECMLNARDTGDFFSNGWHMAFSRLYITDYSSNAAIAIPRSQSAIVYEQVLVIIIENEARLHGHPMEQIKHIKANHLIMHQRYLMLKPFQTRYRLNKSTLFKKCLRALPSAPNSSTAPTPEEIENFQTNLSKYVEMIKVLQTSNYPIESFDGTFFDDTFTAEMYKKHEKEKATQAIKEKFTADMQLLTSLKQFYTDKRRTITEMLNESRERNTALKNRTTVP